MQTHRDEMSESILPCLVHGSCLVLRDLECRSVIVHNHVIPIGRQRFDTAWNPSLGWVEDLKNFNHSVGPAAAMQAGTKGNFTHSSGIPSRFASLHDVPCLLPPSAGFAWVSTCSHQLVTRRQVSSRCKPVKREFTSRTEDLPDTAAESMPRLSQNTNKC